MTELYQNLKISSGLSPQVGEITNWQPFDGPLIYEHLEQFNWAPWLAATGETLSSRAKIFPQGQLILKNAQGIPLASLSTNCIYWDGDPKSLPTWDQVAGDPTTYENTYNDTGNTLVLMSMNVHPEYQGLGLARLMIEVIKQRALDLQMSSLVGSFRPNQFGKYKAEKGCGQTTFSDYCLMSVDKDGQILPKDGWLRSLVRNGMIPLKVDENAMVIPVSRDEFLGFKNTYNTQYWQQVMPEIWECGEVGQWTVFPKENLAVYRESNLYGIIPIK